MKKITPLFALLLVAFCMNSQTIYTTHEAYDNIKKSGHLNPKAKYKFLEASAQSKIKNPEPIIDETTTLSYKTTTTSPCQCMMPVDPTFSLVPMVGYASPYRNDDGSSASIPLGFNFCFYGTTYTNCYINNNGNITFVNNLASFSAGSFPAGNALSPDTIMIAPFWGDVDTRNALSGLVYYKKTATALIVKWSSVGYYSNMADKTNDFQLIITDGSDPILVNGNNVAFCFGDMQWTTGAASSGVGGFGGVPATVGVNKGDNINYVQIGRFDKVGSSYDGPYGLNDGISFLDNKSYFFNTCGTGGNLPPIIQDASGGGSTCGDTLRICSYGDTVVYTTTFLAPELGQTMTISPSAPTLGGSFIPLGVTSSAAGLTTYAWMVVGSPSVTGVHTIIITGTDNGLPSLSTSATYFVKIQNLVIPQPTLSTSPLGSTVCATPGATITLVNCAAYDNVYWSNGSSGCSIIANASGAYYVTVQKTGCFKSTKDSIVVFPNPSPIVFGPLNYCVPATSTTLSVSPPLPGMAAYTSYTWTAGGITTPTVALGGSLMGTSYTIAVTDAHGCTGKSTFTVSSNTPTLGVTANPLSLCGTGSSTLTASISGATSYIWSNGATTQSTTVSVGGVYTCTVNASFCIVTNTISVTISPTPTVTIPSIAGMCSGSSATVAASTFSPIGAYTYTWSTGSNAPNITITTSTVVTLQVTNTVTGCVSLISNTCNVVASSNPTVTMSGTPIVFCNGFNATLPPVVSGGTPVYTYSWVPGTLGTSSTATTNVAGTYTVLVTDQNLCKGSTTVSVVKSSPNVTLSSPDLTICPNECSIITAAGTSSFAPFTYSWGGSTVTTSSISICNAGNVIITFTDAKGCIKTNTITVVNDVLPVASFSATPPSPVIPGQVITFVNTSTISSGTIGAGYWTFGDGGSATGNTVNYAYAIAGTFPITLFVTGSNGCSDTITMNYVVDALILAPNVFTPNGDNVNETLKFKNLEFFPSNNLTILNRWGIKIFEKDSYKNDWNGGGVVDGTYFYILSVPGSNPTLYKGFFQIIR